MGIPVFDTFVNTLLIDIIEAGVTERSVIVDAPADMPAFRKVNKAVLDTTNAKFIVYGDQGQELKTIQLTEDQVARSNAAQAQTLANEAKLESEVNTSAIETLDGEVVKKETDASLLSLSTPKLKSTGDIVVSVNEVPVSVYYQDHVSFEGAGFVTGQMLPKPQRLDGHFVTWGALKDSLKGDGDASVAELTVYHGWTGLDKTTINETEILDTDNELRSATGGVYGDSHQYDPPEGFKHITEASFIGVRGDGSTLLENTEAKHLYIAHPKNKVSPEIAKLEIHGQTHHWDLVDLTINGEEYQVMISEYKNIAPNYSISIKNGGYS